MDSVPGVRLGESRKVSAARRLGYSLLPGETFSYLLHLRPREWPIVAGHALFGFALAIPVSSELGERWGTALLGTFLFVICLNGGTLAINSAFDRDEGDIGYLDAPPPPPRHLFAFGAALMALGQIVTLLLLPALFSAVYAACLVMSVLYSVPPFRWKAVAGLDLVINAAGFGVLTPLAGWALSGVPLAAWAIIILLGFGPLFAALYPLTQFYQLEEDRARGDRTLALLLGVHSSLLFSVAMTVAAFLLISLGVALAPGGGVWPLVLIPLIAWLALLLRWLRQFPTMSSADHKRGMYRALQAWALTNLAVLAAVLL